jgi:hypothetical protein
VGVGKRRGSGLFGQFRVVGVFAIALAFAVRLVWFFRWYPGFAFVARLVWFARVCAGIRALPSCFKRRPCAGRHLLFFAAAKKSRQKKAAHTANISSCLRALNRSHTSHGNISIGARCQRFE